MEEAVQLGQQFFILSESLVDLVDVRCEELTRYVGISAGGAAIPQESQILYILDISQHPTTTLPPLPPLLVGKWYSPSSTVIAKGFLLVFDLLFDVSVGLLRDEGNQVLHALWPQQEVHQLVVLGLALLQDVVFVHHLQQRDVLLLQQRVDVRRGVEVKFPKHDDSERAKGSNDLLEKSSTPPTPTTGLPLLPPGMFWSGEQSSA